MSEVIYKKCPNCGAIMERDDSADILWDIYQALRYEIWKNRPEPKSHITVDAFPATQFGKEPLCKVTSKEE